MKTYILVLVAAIFLLTGCAGEIAETTPTQITETTVAEEPLPVQQITEQDILDIFNGYAYADSSNRVAVACIVMEESENDIIGVVQYTVDDYEGTCFDFIRSDGFPLKAGVNAKTTGDSLKFIAADTVQCQLLDENGEVFGCKITYYADSIEIGFKIETVQEEE